MHSAIIAWIENGFLLVDWTDQMESPTIRPSAFMEQSAANRGERQSYGAREFFENLGLDFVMTGGFVCVQRLEYLQCVPSSQHCKLGHIRVTSAEERAIANFRR